VTSCLWWKSDDILKSNWTWFYEMNLTFEKCPRTPIFSETCFSQVNDVRLSMYSGYVVTKNGIVLFHWKLNSFALKMDSFWKSCIMRRTLWITRFLGSWPVKRTCMYTYTHKWLVCMHSCENYIKLLNYYGDVVGVYICYVHICCWWIFLHVIGVELLV